jgi:hypothetical protein
MTGVTRMRWQKGAMPSSSRQPLLLRRVTLAQAVFTTNIVRARAPGDFGDLVEIDIESGETQRTPRVLSPAVVAVDGA